MTFAYQHIGFGFSAADRVWLEVVPNLSTNSAAFVDSVRADLERSLAAGVYGGKGFRNSGQIGNVVAVLDVHFDPDHQRSVWSIAGNPPGIVFAVVQLAALALDRIDLRNHSGVHPRMGAVDVVPVVPLRIAALHDQDLGPSHGPDSPETRVSQSAREDRTTTDLEGMWALWAAREIAQRLWVDFGIPSYFYGAAATCSARESLPRIRKPFERLEEEIGRGWLPDVGDPIAHPRWGASAVGVRSPLVAFNVTLATCALDPAKRIAVQIRRMRDEGELEGVMAMAFPLPSRGRVQVSMNLTLPGKAGVEAAFSAVLSLADREGVDVEGAEVVGLVPRAALEGHSQKLLELCPDLFEHVLEDRILQCGLQVADSASSTKPLLTFQI